VALEDGELECLASTSGGGHRGTGGAGGEEAVAMIREALEAWSHLAAAKERGSAVIGTVEGLSPWIDTAGQASLAVVGDALRELGPCFTGWSRHSTVHHSILGIVSIYGNN
jgi:hypothetical protein